MSSAVGSDLQRITACEEHFAKASPSSPRTHKRIDSKDFVGIGGHFRPLATQISWPLRPPHIDEILEATTSPQSNISHEWREPASSSGLGDSTITGDGDAPAITSPPTQPRDTQCISKADAAHLISQRDAPRGRKSSSGQRTDSSASSTCDSPPSITEDKPLGTQTPRDGNRTPINYSRPPTPPYHSVATTESEYDSDGKGPVSPQPWSTTNGHKRKRSDGDSF